MWNYQIKNVVHLGRDSSCRQLPSSLQVSNGLLRKGLVYTEGTAAANMTRKPLRINSKGYADLQDHHITTFLINQHWAEAPSLPFQPYVTVAIILSASPGQQ